MPAAVDSGRVLALLALGAALGATLYLASFGFASAYRRMLEERDTAGVRAQIVMLAAASLMFAPLLSQQPGAGAVAPAGAGVAAGAFLFGIGMQLAGGCASGTLFSAGGGELRMAVVLAAFCAGGFRATSHMDWWGSLPALEPMRLGDHLGWAAAVAAQLAVLGVLYLALARVGRGGAPPRALLAGALALAVLNALTLAIAGHPWSITWAFALWGAKAARALGWDPDGEPFWAMGFAREALDGSVFADSTSVMNFGLVLGAFAAAVAAGGFRLRWRLSCRSLLAAAVGGLSMGYGARIAYGCNIGAFFSGVASTSPHGWLWIAAALPGSWLGLRLARRWQA